MKICDRTFHMTGKAVQAGHELTIDHQVFHLCPDQMNLVYDFICNPPKRGRPKKGTQAKSE